MKCPEDLYFWWFIPYWLMECCFVARQFRCYHKRFLRTAWDWPEGKRWIIFESAGLWHQPFSVCFYSHSKSTCQFCEELTTRHWGDKMYQECEGKSWYMNRFPGFYSHHARIYSNQTAFLISSGLQVPKRKNILGVSSLQPDDFQEIRLQDSVRYRKEKMRNYLINLQRISSFQVGDKGLICDLMLLII